MSEALGAEALDHDAVARDVLRALRAHRSQVQWSRWLGYRSNVAYAWEAGRRWPTAAEALRAAGRGGVDVRAAIEAFLGAPPSFLDGLDPASPEGVAAFLRSLRGAEPVGHLAARAGVTRFALARWLAADTQPRLPDFLRVVDAATVRLVDLVAALVPAEQVPSVAPLWARMEARRRMAFDAPWTQAVLRALELEDYRRRARHDDAAVAASLGLDVSEVRRCLQLLEGAAQIRWDGQRWAVEALAVDTRRRPEIGRHLKRFWSEVAAARVADGDRGQFSYNVFSVSRADLARIRALHLEYFHTLRAIVAESEPGECVAVANVQLFALDGDPPW